MVHLEFYVLWANRTWTVEGVDVEDQGLLNETIHVAPAKAGLSAPCS